MQMRNHPSWWTIPLILRIYTLWVVQMALAHCGCQKISQANNFLLMFFPRPGEQTTRVLLTFVVIHISPTTPPFVSLSDAASSGPSLVFLSHTVSFKRHLTLQNYAEICSIVVVGCAKKKQQQSILGHLVCLEVCLICIWNVGILVKIVVEVLPGWPRGFA